MYFVIFHNTPSAIMEQSNAADYDDGGKEPRYPGEDTRPTTTKELFGFYVYSFAAEVFIVCGIGTARECSKITR